MSENRKEVKTPSELFAEIARCSWLALKLLAYFSAWGIAVIAVFDIGDAFTAPERVIQMLFAIFLMMFSEI
jgi:hypothetical protein